MNFTEKRALELLDKLLDNEDSWFITRSERFPKIKMVESSIQVEDDVFYSFGFLYTYIRNKNAFITFTSRKKDISACIDIDFLPIKIRWKILKLQRKIIYNENKTF